MQTRLLLIGLYFVGILWMVFFTVVTAQSERFTQEIAKILPEETFCIATLEKPSEVSTRWLQQIPGSLISEPYLQNVSALFLQEFFRIREFEEQKQILQQIISLSASSDAGIAIAGTLPSKDSLEKAPQLFFIAKASHPSKIKYWGSFFQQNISKGSGEVAQKFKTAQDFEFYGVGLSGYWYKECYYGVMDQYFLLTFEKSSMERLSSNIRAKTTQGSSLSQESSFQKGYEDHFHSATSGFFFYVNLAKSVYPSGLTLGQELFQNVREFSSFLEWLGVEKLQAIAGSLQFKGNGIEDSASAYFSESVALTNFLKDKTVSGVAADLCPQETAVLGTITLSPEAIVKWVLDMVSHESGRRAGGNELLGEIEERFQFSIMNDFVGLLGNELSIYFELPFYGILPKGALLLPLRSPEKFFEKLTLIVSSQQAYSLETEEYLNHRFYYLKPTRSSRSYFGDPFLVSFTYLQGHFVLSYHPAGVKSLIYAVQQNQPKLSSSAGWLNYKDHTSGKHQGTLFVDNQKVFPAIYELVQQISMFFLPMVAISLPDVREIISLFRQSLLTLDIMPQQIKISCEGDAFGVASFGYLGFYFGLTEMFSYIHKNKSTLPKNETNVFNQLKVFVTAQQQFQMALLKDRDLDGVGEYGYFTELSGIHNVPVGDQPGTPADPPFINKVLGETSQKNGGIAEKEGYYFKIYLSSNTGAIPENGQAVSPVASFPPSIEEAQTINLQETYWICYAWPIEYGVTGNKCFVVNQEGSILISKNADYSGLTKVPSSEACFSRNNQANPSLGGTIRSGQQAGDGFIWTTENLK